MIENEGMITIAFLGEEEVGKTSFIRKYFHRAEPKPEYIPTIAVEASYASFECADGSSIRIKYWDTAGDPKYKNIICFHLKEAEIVVLMYDKTDP